MQGHGTGWCTAGESTAIEQLKAGDFYVFYSNDKMGLPKVPRVAIRMENGEIAEVRGINKDQELEPVLFDVVQEKMQGLPGGEKYEKKVGDMKRLTEIERKFIKTSQELEKCYEKRRILLAEYPDSKYRADRDESIIHEIDLEVQKIRLKNEELELTPEELKFLYEIDGEIEGFGYKKDPRIEGLKEKRNQVKDLSIFFDDFKELADIEEKNNHGQELSQEELRSLYKRENFTIADFHKDQEKYRWYPLKIRIRKETKDKRDQKKDYAVIFDCLPEEVAVTQEELKKETIVYVGDLIFPRPVVQYSEDRTDMLKFAGEDYFEGDEIQMPENLRYIIGDADFRVSNIKNFGKLEAVEGSLYTNLYLQLSFGLSRIQYNEIIVYEDMGGNDEKLNY